MRKTLALTFASAGLLISGVAVSPANAVPAAWNDCLSGHFCLFEDHNGGRLMYAYDECTPLGVVDIGAVGEGGKVSSVWNRSRFLAHTYNYFHGWQINQVHGADTAEKNYSGANDNVTDGFRVFC